MERALCGLTCELRAVVNAGKCWTMNDMQQILAGVNDLNERRRVAEVRATEAERQAQAIQQELTRSQAGVKGKVKCVAVFSTTGAWDRRVCVEVLASAV